MESKKVIKTKLEKFNFMVFSPHLPLFTRRHILKCDSSASFSFGLIYTHNGCCCCCPEIVADGVNTSADFFLISCEGVSRIFGASTSIVFGSTAEVVIFELSAAVTSILMLDFCWVNIFRHGLIGGGVSFMTNEDSESGHESVQHTENMAYVPNSF